MKLVLLSGIKGCGVSSIANELYKHNFKTLVANEMDMKDTKLEFANLIRLNRDMVITYEPKDLNSILKVILSNHKNIKSSIQLALVNIDLSLRNRLVITSQEHNVDITDPILSEILLGKVIPTKDIEKMDLGNIDDGVKKQLQEIYSIARNNRLSLYTYSDEDFEETNDKSLEQMITYITNKIKTGESNE